MGYHCEDCIKDLEELMPDGSCPDCYSAAAIVQKNNTTVVASAGNARELLKTNQAARSDQLNHTVTAGQYNQPPLPAMPEKRENWIDPTTVAAMTVHQGRQFLAEILFPRIEKMYPYLAPKITQIMVENFASVDLLLMLEQPQLFHSRMVETASLLLEYNQHSLNPVNQAQAGIYNNGGQIGSGQILQQPYPQMPPHRPSGVQTPLNSMQVGDLRQSVRYYFEHDSRQHPPTPSSGAPNAKPWGQNVSLRSDEMNKALQHFRVDILSLLDTCRDASALHGAARHLQNSVEAMEHIKKEFESRSKKVLGGEISLQQMAHGLEKKSAPGLSGPEKKRRPRKHPVACDTIVVQNLPDAVTRGDLFNYFSKYCESVADVKNIVLPMEQRGRGLKGPAYVTLAHENMVRKILSQSEDHKIKNSVVTVVLFDEQEQVRRRAAYQIFAGGLSSFTSDETFEDYLWDNFGEVEGLYYHPNLENPGVDNAYAYIAFRDQNVTNAILEAKSFDYNGKTIRCKPYMNARSYIDTKKRDGTFGPNWRERSDKFGEGRLQTSVNGRESAKPPGSVKEAVKEIPPAAEKPGVLCVVCAVNEVCIVLKPCGHVCLCDGCSDMLEKCPYCSQDVNHKEKIYVVGF